MTIPGSGAGLNHGEFLSTHLLDSRALGSLFASNGMRKVFNDRATVQAWLDAEVALAEAQSEMGLIPAGVAAEIKAGADADAWDLGELAVEVQRTGHPLVPAIRELTRRAGEAGGWVHFGATTQDIMDTGLVIQCQQGLAL
ncbi:MAG: 3-carboxy-cis,cis-muconate cycloisomerase, partial [Actinomycetota bacterium]|nr:3-carboxy-cis,cis-muconate cycloisomerase [Actinomycetota bacterium]